MSEKERTKIEEENSDHATEESGGKIDEKRLLRKLDWHLLPLATVLFLLSFLDRSNGDLLAFPFLHLPPAHFLSVGNARIEGLAADLHMSRSLLPKVHGQLHPYHLLK